MIKLKDLHLSIIFILHFVYKIPFDRLPYITHEDLIDIYKNYNDEFMLKLELELMNIKLKQDDFTYEDYVFKSTKHKVIKVSQLKKMLKKNIPYTYKKTMTQFYKIDYEDLNKI